MTDVLEHVELEEFTEQSKSLFHCHSLCTGCTNKHKNVLKNTVLPSICGELSFPFLDSPWCKKCREIADMVGDINCWMFFVCAVCGLPDKRRFKI